MVKIRTLLGYYISDLVYGANDGIITTFAVVSGAAGAGFSARVIVILGVANLIADGFSMGASKYLSLTSEQDYQGVERTAEHARDARIDGSITFLAFVAAGFLPLMPFFYSVSQNSQFLVSAVATAAALFFVGAARSIVTRRNFFVSGLEMLFVGGIAAAIAYGIGFLVERLV